MASSLPILLLIVGAMAANVAQAANPEDGADVTAAAFGDFYDMSDGAPPVAHGGGFKDIVSGDTWFNTWGRDDTAYLTQDDGLGFYNLGGLFARSRLCRLDGNPNLSTDGFRGVNLNPGLLGNTIPNSKNTPESRIGYTSTIYEQDGTLYVIRHDWSPSEMLWPPVDSSFIKSPDGGRTWIDHLGRVNEALPDKEHAFFHSLPWSSLSFVQYGRGGASPGTDNADKYAYLTAVNYLARIPKDKLSGLNKKDFQFYRGSGLDGMLDSSWSNDMTEGGPMVRENVAGLSKEDAGLESERPPKGVPLKMTAENFRIANVVYDFQLKRYLAAGRSFYSEPADSAHKMAKARFMIYTARHPWGPWHLILSYGIWARASWNALLSNKFTTGDGRKMWMSFCGDYKGDVWNYGFQYNPVYLSSGLVDIYEAENAKLEGMGSAAGYPSYSGTGYAGGFSNLGGSISFTIHNVNGTGWHIVRMRYTSPKSNGATLSIYVNGTKARRVKLSLNRNDFLPQENWSDRSDIYFLRQGANTFEIRQDDGDAAEGVMIDYIAVSRDRTYEEGKNIAPEAVTSSSSGDARNAIKGCVDGARQWVSNGTNGEWIKLNWPAPVAGVRKIVLYDQVSARDQVVSGTLAFSDGSAIKVGRLQNDGQAENDGDSICSQENRLGEVHRGFGSSWNVICRLGRNAGLCFQ